MNSRRSQRKQNKRQWIYLPTNPRDLLCFAILVLFWDVILEGAVRTWLLPAAQQLIFFAKDILLLWIYYYTWRNKLWPKSRILNAFLIVAVLAIPLIAVQVVLDRVSPVACVYGWRMYFYWIPLAFIIGDLFTGKDIARLIRQTLLFAIPISVLCYMQFKSPADAWVNKTYTGDANNCTVDWHTVRPALTFSFPSATPVFVGFIASMVVALWLLPSSQRPLSNKTFLLSCVALLVLTAFNGNRTLWFNLIFCLCGGLIAASQLALSRRSMRSLISLTIACVAGGVFMNFFCSDGVSLIANKYSQSEGIEGDSVGARILCNFVEIANAVDTTPIYGWGIGVGSGGGSFLATGQRSFTMGETEWLRNFQECGVLGLVFIALRGVLAAVIVKDAWIAVKRTKNPFPLTLCAIAVPMLVMGAVTIASTINALGWFITGVQIAINRLNTRDTKTTSPLPKVEIGQG